MTSSVHLPSASASWAYFLDLDGTLVNLAATPDAINIDAGLNELLLHVHHRTSGALAVISGRSLADLDKKLGPIGIPLAGQHGVERRDQTGRIHRHSSFPNQMAEIERRVAERVAKYPALRIENKGATLAIHYRKAPDLGGYAHQVARESIEDFRDRLTVLTGKMVSEIKPLGVSKGNAIKAFLRELPFRGRVPVFVGDDRTDEDGFAVIEGLGGISIKVGEGPTRAAYRLEDVEAVRAWLSGLA